MPNKHMLTTCIDCCALAASAVCKQEQPQRVWKPSFNQQGPRASKQWRKYQGEQRKASKQAESCKLPLLSII